MDSIYFILSAHFYFILFLFSYLELRIRVSVILYMMVTYVTKYNKDITPVIVTYHKKG